MCFVYVTVSSFLSLKKIYYFIHHQYILFENKNLRLKNNLLSYNRRLRDVITKKNYINQVTIKKWL